jgi:hypothetical protein
MTRVQQEASAVFVAVVLTGGLLLSGCAGGDSYSVRVEDLADRYLPTTREVDYPPDSLGALSIEKTDDRYEVELTEGYAALHRRWSSSYQNLGTGRSRSTRSYATFWSKELSLASLQAETGLSSLTPDRAEKLLAERRQDYRSTLQFDVYWFEAEGRSIVTGPGNRVELEIGERTYRPVREDHGPLREAFLAGGGQALYRRNTIHFPRIVDSTDVLKDAEGMTLTLNRSGAGSRVRFAWEWPSR